MTPLRKKMVEDMRLRNLRERTRGQYVNCVSVYARHHGVSPARLGTPEVRAFLLFLVELGRTASTCVVYHAALRFLYDVTLLRPEVMQDVPRPRVPRTKARSPLTRDEVRTLLEAARPKPYVYTFLATALTTGLRLSELCNLRVEDIDAGSEMIHVRDGKGAKARWVKLGGRHLQLLRRYWEVERPGGPWLFPPQRMTAPGKVGPMRHWKQSRLSVSGAHSRLRTVTRSAKLARGVTHHDLRRTYGTWLLEAGVDLRVVQVLLGHDSPETTTRYTEVRPDLIRSTPSLLDML